MRFTVISILILIFISSLSSCVEFDFDFHKDDQNKQVIVNIHLDTRDKYDIKVFVHNSTDGKITQKEIFSKTFNNQNWQTSWNYLKESYPDKSEYIVKYNEFIKDSSICVRARPSSKTNFLQICKNLTSSENYLINNTPENKEKIFLNNESKSTKGTIVSKNQILLNWITWVSMGLCLLLIISLFLSLLDNNL